MTRRARPNEPQATYGALDRSQRAFLSYELTDPEAVRLMRAGRIREALPLAERAVAGACACVPGHGLLSTILLQLGRSRDAEKVVTQAMGLETGSAEAYDALAYVSMILNRHDRANVLYRRATELEPRVPRYWYNLACSERSFGRLADAEKACDRCLALDPTQHATFMLRSELRVQTRDANHIEELRACLDRVGLDERSKAYLGYALAKELDDVQCFDDAFHWFAQSAKARRSLFRYDIADDERKLRRIGEVFTRDIVDAAAAPREVGASTAVRGDGGARCIFIVGLPRSGTTLVERILSGLPGVRSNDETDNLARALTTAAKRTAAATSNAASTGVGNMIERAAAADPLAVAETYARLARVSESGWVIEKLPTNYLYLGAIRRAMPNARIVSVARAPVDSCFAMFRTLFGEAFPFSYDFEELARYYAAYAALMNHWRFVLGESLHEVVYEELVREPGRVGARMAQHCGLSWNEAALDIENNRSVALTASAAQVRRPIYGTSSGRWRQYRTHLEPLIAALRRRGVPVPEDA